MVFFFYLSPPHCRHPYNELDVEMYWVYINSTPPLHRGERDIFAHDDKNPFITMISEPSLSNPGAGPVLNTTEKKIIITLRMYPVQTTLHLFPAAPIITTHFVVGVKRLRNTQIISSFGLCRHNTVLVFGKQKNYTDVIIRGTC